MNESFGFTRVLCSQKLSTISKYLQSFCTSSIDLRSIWLIPVRRNRSHGDNSQVCPGGPSWSTGSWTEHRSRGSRSMSVALRWPWHRSIWTWAASLCQRLLLLRFLLSAPQNKGQDFPDKNTFSSALQCPKHFQFQTIAATNNETLTWSVLLGQGFSCFVFCFSFYHW